MSETITGSVMSVGTIRNMKDGRTYCEVTLNTPRGQMPINVSPGEPVVGAAYGSNLTLEINQSKTGRWWGNVPGTKQPRPNYRPQGGGYPSGGSSGDSPKEPSPVSIRGQCVLSVCTLRSGSNATPARIMAEAAELAGYVITGQVPQAEPKAQAQEQPEDDYDPDDIMF